MKQLYKDSKGQSRESRDRGVCPAPLNVKLKLTTMETYAKLPQLTLQLKRGEVLSETIHSSGDVARVFRQIWDQDSLVVYESVLCLFLDRQNRTIGWMKVSQGGLSSSIVDNRLILVTALNCLATGLILAHNHPSGSLDASEADRQHTQKLKEACKILDIELLDNLILTETGYTSFADCGWL